MKRTPFVGVVAVFVVLVGPFVKIAHAQMDDRFRRQEAETGGVVRAFGVDTRPEGPLEIVDVTQIRQAYGNHRFAIVVRNRSSEPVASYTVTGLVVSGDGGVRATQPLAPVKNLKPGQSRRQEFDRRVAVLSLSDRLAFAVSEVKPATGEPWKISEHDLRATVKAAAQVLQRER
jgi:hypothetical protein